MAKTKKLGDDPAFPVTFSCEVYSGMDRRYYTAVEAMKAMISHNGTANGRAYVAEMAFRMADEMLKAECSKEPVQL